MNPKTEQLSTNRFFSSFGFCTLGEELAVGLEKVGIVSADSNATRSCSVPGDISDEEMRTWESDCENGNSEKCFWRGMYKQNEYLDLEDAGDAKKAASMKILAQELLSKACDDNVISACRGAAFLLPTNNDQYATKSIELFEKSCALLDMRSCRTLGYIYKFGESGLSKDNFKAIEHFSMACDAHDGDACAQLVEMGFYGDRGANRYRRNAKALLAFGCRTGTDWACEAKFK